MNKKLRRLIYKLKKHHREFDTLEMGQEIIPGVKVFSIDDHREGHLCLSFNTEKLEDEDGTYIYENRFKLFELMELLLIDIIDDVDACSFKYDFDTNHLGDDYFLTVTVTDYFS